MRCKQFIIVSLAGAALAASLAGCGGAAPASSAAASSEAASSVVVSSAAAETALPDGVYTADFETDSSMFHASEACNGKEFANYWLHNAFLNIDNRKMSKSLGNFRTVREISEQYDLQVLRFFMLSAHYRSPLNFSAELMEASKNGLERILNATDNLKHLIASVAAEEMSAEEKEAFSKTDAYVEEFEKAMDDDFNTADAIAAIFELVKYANTTATAESSKEYLRGLLDRIVKLGDVLGLILDKKEELLDADIEKLIEERQAARKEKNFARADEIRDELLAKGIVLKDTREGVQWKRA